MGRPQFSTGVERPQDRAAREVTFKNKQDAKVGLIDGNSDTVVFENTSGQTQFLVGVSAVETDGSTDTNSRIQVSVVDSTSTAILSWFYLLTNQNTLEPPREIPVPDEGEVRIITHNDDGTSHDYAYSYNYFTEG